MKHTRVEDHHDLTTGRGRLEYLATILDRVEALRQPFDIGDWQEVPNDCGTAACAMGWACREPAFKQAGLKTNGIGWPEWDGYHGFEAAMEFTGLSYLMSDYLFHPAYYDTPPTAADVAARIRQVLAEVGT